MLANIATLRYSISDWSQAVDCLSNNDKQLKIKIANFLHNPNFDGQVISVVHPEYGVLFAAATKGVGTFVSETSASGDTLNFLTTSEILEQLHKYGFDIIYEEEPNLSGEELTFLMKLLDLGYDSITRVVIASEGQRRKTATVVAYDSKRNVSYLTFGTLVPRAQFNSALDEGWLLNVSAMDKSLKWDWLTYTCQIPDILEANIPTDEFVKIPELPEPQQVPTHQPQPVASPYLPESYPIAYVEPDTSQFHVYGEVVEVSDEEYANGTAQS